MCPFSKIAKRVYHSIIVFEKCVRYKVGTHTHWDISCQERGNGGCSFVRKCGQAERRYDVSASYTTRTVQWDISSQKRGNGVKNLQRINFRLKVQIRCMGPAWQLSLSTFPIHTLGPFYRKEEMGLLICKKCFLDER